MVEVLRTPPSLAAAWARSLPFGLYMLVLALTPWLTHWFADVRWLYAWQIGAVALGLGWFARRYVELARPGAMRAGDLIWALGIGVAVFLAWINLELPGLAWEGGKGFNPSQPDGSLNGPLIVLRIAGAALVVPVMEELFWRSFLLRWFDRADFMQVAPADVSWRALLFCAIPFGLEHNLWFAGVVAGLAYGWLYRRSGSLWAPIVAHALTNLLLGLWVVNTGNWRFW